MKDILLNYVMKVDAYAPTPSASTAYIRKVLCVVKPLPEGDTGTITECTTKAEVQALTNASCYKMLEAGMNSIFVLPTNTLDVDTIIDATDKQFFTVLIDNAFDDTDLESLDLGAFEGVVGWCVDDRTKAKTFGYSNNNVGFYDAAANNSVNMYHAFGKMLSANNWKNQQYIEMPLASGIDTINMANLMFEDSISFVLTSREYGNRLGLFASNRRAIIAPYIYEELTLNLQSKALQYISLNQPNYTAAEASLLEDTLQTVIDRYIEEGYIEKGSITISLGNQQFVANAKVEVPEPKALWRIFATMKQGEI